MKNTTWLRGLTVALTLGALAGLGACEGNTGPDDLDPMTDDDAAAMASFLSDVDALAVGVAALASTSGGRTITKTTSCPAGGSVTLNGSSESSLDEDTRVVSGKWSMTQTHAACAVTHTRGDKSVTAVMDGSVTAAGTSSYQLPETRGGSRTLLAWASTKVGSTTTKVGDKTRTCEVNLTETYDAAKKTFTITGVMCGRQVDITRSR